MLKLSLFLRIFHTVRFLKVRQLAYQVYYRVHKPRIRELSAPAVRGEFSAWSGESFMAPATKDGSNFTFLGQSARLDEDWNDPGFPKLWLYNLHYQDDLNATGAESRGALCARMVEAWIAGNPPLQGNGWEPYCLSLRMVNWVKFFSRLGPEGVNEKWLRSLIQQTDVLEQRLEFHILANHLFANAKALVFVGAYLGGAQGDHWLRKGLALLDAEVKEQFLDDGAHYERSPMYQGTLLWDLADLIALERATQLPELEQRKDDWQQRFCRGLEWLMAMSHPDGEIAFFNDATFGIAPGLETLSHYAQSLALPVPERNKPGMLVGTLFPESGYGVVEWPEDHRLLVDVAPVGPDYQPGHAHADTLSCELSLFGQRALVNSGISQYGEGEERHRQRSTAAHNTVEVDGENSSEVWAGFRVARRAMPLAVNLENSHARVLLQAGHDGYKRLEGKPVHYRRWIAVNESLTIEDELVGCFERAVAYWHFHPELRVEQDEATRFKVHLPDGQIVVIEVSGGSACLVASSWHPGFGVSDESQKLAVTFSSPKFTTRISWSSI